MPEAMKISSLILCAATILVAAPVSFTPAFAQDELTTEQPAKKKGKKKKKSGKPLPPKTQDLEIRNLRVRYKLNADAAIDSLFGRYVDIKIFADGFLIKKDSLALSADTTRVSTPTTNNN